MSSCHETEIVWILLALMIELVAHPKNELELNYFCTLKRICWGILRTNESKALISA